MSAVDPKGNESFYINGEPFQGLRLESTKVGSEKYWFEGEPEQNLTPPSNSDTGKMFFLFE